MLTLKVVLFNIPALLSSINAASVPNSANAAIIHAGTSSRTDSALSVTVSAVTRVNPQVHPDWAGFMDPGDCRRARTLVQGRVAFYDPDKDVTFWSRRGAIEPEGDSFELPFGWRYGERLSGSIQLAPY